MSMLIPGQNQLAEPALITVEAFEDLLAEFKTFVIEYVGARSPASAVKLKASLENESELLTLALEAFCVRLQTHERKYNARIKQMLAWWATGSNLDARLADMAWSGNCSIPATRRHSRRCRRFMKVMTTLGCVITWHLMHRRRVRGCSIAVRYSPSASGPRCRSSPLIPA
jgi:phage-related baseplate assembly protein